MLSSCATNQQQTVESRPAFSPDGIEEIIDLPIEGSKTEIPLKEMSKWGIWGREENCASSTISTEGDFQTFDFTYTGNEDFSISILGKLPVDSSEANSKFLLSSRIFVASGKFTLCYVVRDSDDKVINWTYGETSAFPKNGYQSVFSIINLPENAATIEPRFIGTGNTFVKIKETTFEKIETKVINESLSLENDYLKVICNPASASFQITDKRINKTYSQGTTPLSGILISSAKTEGNAFIISGINIASKSAIELKAELISNKIEYSVKMETLDQNSTITPMNTNIEFPQKMITSAGDYMVIPMNEGVRVNWNETDFYKWELAAFSGHGICMPFFGITNDKDGSGFVSIINTPDDAAIRMNDGNTNSISTIWYSQKGNFGYERKLTQTFLTEGNHVAIAKTYRQYAKEQGTLVTFAEKKAQRSEEGAKRIDQLLGAVNIWCWFWEWDGHYPEPFVKELLDCGIDQIFWSNKQSPEQVAKINDLGVLTGRYDIYQDVMDPSKYKQLNHVSEDWLPEAFPQDIVRERDGSLRGAWPVETKNGDMIRCSCLCDVVAPDYARKKISEEMSKYAFGSRFFDTATAEQLRECYSPDHPMTRTECKQHRIDLLSIASRDYNLVTGSETGMDFVVPVCDYFEGMMSLGPYRVEDAGRKMEKIYDEIPPQITEYQVNEKRRLPLWELVYHDACVAMWYWGDYNNKLPAVWDKRDKFNQLYAVPPMFWILNEQYFRENKDRFVQSYKASHDILVQTAGVEMTNHEYLNEDHTIQKTTFANGLEIIVSFNED